MRCSYCNKPIFFQERTLVKKAFKPKGHHLRWQVIGCYCENCAHNETSIEYGTPLPSPLLYGATWTTSDKRVLDLNEMSLAHLLNTHRLLKRKGFISTDDYDTALGFACSVQGEMASYYAEQEIADLKPHLFINTLEDAINIRKELNPKQYSRLAESDR